MFKFVILVALAVAANAQVLRLNPLSIGSGHAQNQHVILLGAGGQVPAYRSASVVPFALRAQAPVARLVAAPVAHAPVARFISRVDNEQPEPFAFGFESEDEYGTKMSRSESADGNGKVTGSYSFVDATGISRIVNYVADDEGFRAEVQTNEPGTLTSSPADVQVHSSAQ